MQCTNWIVLWHYLIGSIYIHKEQVTSKFINTGEWVKKRWKDLTDTFQKKEKSGSAGVRFGVRVRQLINIYCHGSGFCSTSRFYIYI